MLNENTTCNIVTSLLSFDLQIRLWIPKKLSMSSALVVIIKSKTIAKH